MHTLIFLQCIKSSIWHWIICFHLKRIVSTRTLSHWNYCQVDNLMLLTLTTQNIHLKTHTVRRVQLTHIATQHEWDGNKNRVVRMCVYTRCRNTFHSSTRFDNTWRVCSVYYIDWNWETTSKEKKIEILFLIFVRFICVFLFHQVDC